MNLISWVHHHIHKIPVAAGSIVVPHKVAAAVDPTLEVEVVEVVAPIPEVADSLDKGIVVVADTVVADIGMEAAVATAMLPLNHNNRIP